MSNNYYGNTIGWTFAACDYCESVDQVKLLEVDETTVKLCAIRLCKECRKRKGEN